MMNDADSLADMAVNALIEELDLFPKPGLVSPVDCGSHNDMDYALLRRSAESLREPFREIAAAPNPSFESLVELGLSAERRMMAATDGINTHRGAIFALGLLVAAAAADPESPRRAVQLRWSDALLQHSKDGVNADSHGAQVRRQSSATGARGEAAAGFPSVFELALPRFRALIDAGKPREAAGIETLFLLIAHVEDTNLYHRGGAAGAAFARQRARDFLDAGGVNAPNWKSTAIEIHGEFVSRNLSPGGGADLLAATIFAFEQGQQFSADSAKTRLATPMAL